MKVPPQKPTKPARGELIAVVAFNGISPFHLSVPSLVFGEDRTELGAPRFRVVVCAAEVAPLATSAGYSLGALEGLAPLARADVVIVPSWRNVHERPPEPLLAALRRAHARGARIVGLCLGAFVLAEAGLLDGRRATTHWQWADAFKARFPSIHLDPTVLYVDDGEIWTSAGTVASIDCCLQLLRERCGAAVANRVARRMVVAPQRRGGQAQFIEQPLPKTDRADRIGETMAWATRRLGQRLDLDQLAAHAAMSRRNFTRRFRERCGTTVTQWLIAQRVARAQQILETTDLAIEQVAAESGFGSALALRQMFGRERRMSPTAYRQLFRAGSVRV